MVPTLTRANIADFGRNGFAALDDHVPAAMLVRLATLFADGGAGGRLTERMPAEVGEVLSWPPLAAALAQIDPALRPVRIMLFSKNDRANWFVPWHQDAAVAIDGDAAPSGFTNPTIKRGVPHWEAPVALLTRMVAVRVHVDPAGANDGPLEVIPGSHADGFVTSDEASTSACRHHICLAAPGEVHVMRPLLLHRSRKAAEPSGRRTVQIELAPSGALPAALSWRLKLPLPFIRASLVP